VRNRQENNEVVNKMPQQPTVLQLTIAQVAQELAPATPAPTATVEKPDEESLIPETTSDKISDEAPSGDAPSEEDITNFDKKQIEIGLTSLDELKEVVNAKGDLFMTVNGVRGYHVNLDYGNTQFIEEQNMLIQNPGSVKPKKKQMEECYIFVWSKPNARVIEFLMSTAQARNIKKILGFTDHAVVVTEYKI
jgi:hypothetical protein